MVLTWIYTAAVSCYIGNEKFDSASPPEICPISNTTSVVLIPNITATHAITKH